MKPETLITYNFLFRQPDIPYNISLKRHFQGLSNDLQFVKNGLKRDSYGQNKNLVEFRAKNKKP